MQNVNNLLEIIILFVIQINKLKFFESFFFCRSVSVANPASERDASRLMIVFFFSSTFDAFNLHFLRVCGCARFRCEYQFIFAANKTKF